MLISCHGNDYQNYSKVTTRRIIAGKWMANNGQACIGVDYIITTKDFAPKLVRSSLRIINLCILLGISFLNACFFYRSTVWEMNWRSFLGKIQWNQKIYLALWIHSTLHVLQASWMKIKYQTKLFMEAKGMKSNCESDSVASIVHFVHFVHFTLLEHLVSLTLASIIAER